MEKIQPFLPLDHNKNQGSCLGTRGLEGPYPSLTFLNRFLLKWPRLRPRWLSSRGAHFEYGMVHPGDIRSLADVEWFMQTVFTASLLFLTHPQSFREPLS